MKRIAAIILCAALCASLAVPVVCLDLGFTDEGGYSETKVEYFFMCDDALLRYSGGIDADYSTLDKFYAGSDFYIPLGAYDTAASSAVETIVTDKQVKEDSIELSYTVLMGKEYVDNISLVSAKKEKLKDIPAGMYVKIEYTDNYIGLAQSSVIVRLVLSVNGVSYQETATTFQCQIANREEEISRNSVYGAITPAQFHASNRYSGEATFDFGGGVKYTGYVKARERYYLNLDRTPDAGIQAIYPAAYMEFYSFKGDHDTFASTGRLEIPVSEQKFKEKRTTAQLYAYEIKGDKLVAQFNSVRYDPKNKKLVFSKRILGDYVLSSRPLMRTVDKESGNILRSGYASSVDSSSEAAGQ